MQASLETTEKVQKKQQLPTCRGPAAGPLWNSDINKASYVPEGESGSGTAVDGAPRRAAGSGTGAAFCSGLSAAPPKQPIGEGRTFVLLTRGLCRGGLPIKRLGLPFGGFLLLLSVEAWLVPWPQCPAVPAVPLPVPFARHRPALGPQGRGQPGQASGMVC